MNLIISFRLRLIDQSQLTSCEMLTHEIEQALNSINSFKCVCSRDQLIKIKKIENLPVCLVVNTDSSKEPGEHWVAILITSNRKADYFDSFGLPPLHRDFVRFLNRVSRTWRYSVKDIQNYSSVKCGEYCISFINHRLHGRSYESYLQQFRTGSLSNDSRLTGDKRTRLAPL